MATPFIAEITLFAGNFAPRGWAFCDGQIMSISNNTALFSIIGTTYGGNGQTTFALPDLRGRVPIGPRQGPGLSFRNLGEVGGEESHTLTAGELAPHAHPGSGAGAQTTNNPSGAYPAKGGAYSATQSVSMGPGQPAGAGQPHNNMEPYLGMNYIIAIEGIFPSRN
jgi:microcystin-dependent protein